MAVPRRRAAAAPAEVAGSAGCTDLAGLAELAVGPYRLRPLRAVRCDDVAAFLGPAPGLFVCNCPEQAWYDRLGRRRGAPMAEARKRAMLARMAPGSRLVSMTLDGDGLQARRAWTSPSGILHLGCGPLRGRGGQLWQAAGALAALLRADRRLAYVLTYNFDQPQFAAAWAAARLSGRRLVVDYEDDYTRQRRAPLKNALEAALHRQVDAAVCIHPAMARAFPGRPTCVASSFADLGYMRGAAPRLHEGIRLVYAGRLDDIRGADLLPALVAALGRHLRHFTVHVAGDGPLRPQVAALRLPQLRYHGFLPAGPLRALLADCHGALVLQRPDHPFSQGSFPSKIETYAAERRVVWTLTAGGDGDGDGSAGAAAAAPTGPGRRSRRRRGR